MKLLKIIHRAVSRIMQKGFLARKLKVKIDSRFKEDGIRFSLCKSCRPAVERK